MPVVLMLALLAFPTLARAQAVTPAALVGSWAQDSAKVLGWSFRADSTVDFVTKNPQGTVMVAGRWTLQGDTLAIRVTSAKINGRRMQANVAKRKVELDKNKLTLTRLDNQQTATYDKVDSLVSATPPAPAAPSTDSSATPKP